MVRLVWFQCRFRALGANSTATLALLNTNTASAAAMLAYIFFDAAQGRKPSSMGAAIGLVIGLVAITPAAGFVNVGSSIFIGVVAAIISKYCYSEIWSQFKIR